MSRRSGTSCCIHFTRCRSLPLACRRQHPHAWLLCPCRKGQQVRFDRSMHLMPFGVRSTRLTRMGHHQVLPKPLDLPRPRTRSCNVKASAEWLIIVAHTVPYYRTAQTMAPPAISCSLAHSIPLHPVSFYQADDLKRPYSSSVAESCKASCIPLAA